MKTVGLLCGIRDSGKTNTLKAFFDVSEIKRLKSMQLLEWVLDGKIIYAVGLTSPQELANDFCNVEKVKTRIRKRIKKCERFTISKDYILLIPFTMFIEDERINERCITEPIEWLGSEEFRVFTVHLRRENDFVYLEDALMKKIAAKKIDVSIIESKNGEYVRQAKELESIIRKL